MLGLQGANGKKEARVRLSSAWGLGRAFRNSTLPGCPQIKWGKMINKTVYWGHSQSFQYALTDKNAFLSHGSRGEISAMGQEEKNHTSQWILDMFCFFSVKVLES